MSELDMQRDGAWERRKYSPVPLKFVVYETQRSDIGEQ